jgi:hypothetical protein
MGPMAHVDPSVRVGAIVETLLARKIGQKFCLAKVHLFEGFFKLTQL